MRENGEWLSAIKRVLQTLKYRFIHIQRNMIGWWQGRHIILCEGMILTGDCHRYYEKVGDYKIGAEPTVGGPRSYFLRIEKIEGRWYPRVHYVSDAMVVDTQGRATITRIKKGHGAKITNGFQLKYEIVCGHLSLHDPRFDIRKMKWTADCEL